MCVCKLLRVFTDGAARHPFSRSSSFLKSDVRHFQLVSRGQVVSTVQPTLTSRSTFGDAYSAEFTVTLTWDMTPVTEVIAYHIVESGHLIQEVVTDSMALNVHGLLENTVSDSVVHFSAAAAAAAAVAAAAFSPLSSPPPPPPPPPPTITTTKCSCCCCCCCYYYSSFSSPSYYYCYYYYCYY